MPSKNMALLAGLLVALASAGCRSASVAESVLPRLAGNEPEAQLDYWHELATKPLVSNDEAFHGLLLYLDGADPATTYAQRVTALKSRRLLPGHFDQPAARALDRGTLAVPLAKLLDLRGGITMRLTGITPRYATRELEYRGVYPPSSTNQVFTGAEFVGVIGMVQDVRAPVDPTDLPASELPVNTSAAAAAPVAPDEADDISPIMAMIQAAQDLTLQSTSLAATAPATTRGREPIRVIVTAVEGLASVREHENAPWKPATKGMELTEQAEFRTGPKGTIQFVIPPDETVSIDRLTTLKVLRLFEEGGKVRTDLGIKYGRTRYDLRGGGLEHQSTLRSPNATLAVRGTQVSLFDQPPFAPQAISLTGRAEFRAAARKQAIAFGRAGQGKTIVTPESETAGDVALSQSVVDPTLPGARTDSETALITTLVSRGATTEIDRESGIRIVRGGIPPADAQLVPALPGRLNFVLRWNADANLDLAVSTPGLDGNPGGEFVYPVANLNISPSGGRTAFDHRGGASGGIEVVYFDNVTDGIYAISGPSLTQAPVTATIDAWLDGQRVQLFDGLELTTTVTQVVGPGQPALALVGVNAPLPFVTDAAARRISPAARGRVRFVDLASPAGAAMGPKPAAPSAPARPAKRKR